MLKTELRKIYKQKRNDLTFEEIQKRQENIYQQIFDLDKRLKDAKYQESYDTMFWREKAESLQKEMTELREKETKYNGMLKDIKSLIE